MKTDIGFEEIGRQTTYKVPGGFFERISSDTLLKAKQRDQKRSKNRMIWQTIAIAASLMTLLYFTYSGPEPLKTGLNQIALDDDSKIKPTVNASETISNSVLVAESTDFVIRKRMRIENPFVELSTVLSEMTDEDLQQMATMYKNDLFLGESPQ